MLSPEVRALVKATAPVLKESRRGADAPFLYAHAGRQPRVAPAVQPRPPAKRPAAAGAGRRGGGLCRAYRRSLGPAAGGRAHRPQARQPGRARGTLRHRRQAFAGLDPRGAGRSGHRRTGRRLGGRLWPAGRSADRTRARASTPPLPPATAAGPAGAPSRWCARRRKAPRSPRSTWRRPTAAPLPTTCRANTYRCGSTCPSWA